MTSPSAGYAIVGRIRKAHGIRGECAVEPLTDAPDVLLASGRRVFAGDVHGDLAPGADGRPQPLAVTGARQHQGGLLVTFDAIGDRATAELWRGRYLLVPMDEVEQPAAGEVFLHELPGMAAVFEDGSSAGVIDTWYELPQGILLSVRHNGAEVLVPFAAQVVVGVDRAGRRVTLRPPDGLFA
ncbi:MAG: 16S rRNA processing protein RimM [Gemmatimonadetes bacterium]|nr:16S rRNA processing protein RimM [Gemmatimonadota bacterium]